ncbi:MAG TPA: hypothetical protein VEH30_14050 [Terriglobales bacterium]|nr:hypothetical protein [Terriglobales bacterium]
MNVQSTPRWDRETTLVSQLAAAASLFSFLFYFRHSDLLLYGDAVAHINIARRVIDSRTPELLQLGTVWLPLPHLLMVPFLLSDTAWQTGIAGAIPSMCAYVFGTAGIFRLVRGALRSQAQPDFAGRTMAWFAAAVYAANPNLLYMQTTAMTEVLYLALFIWAVVHLSEFARSATARDVAKQQQASLANQDDSPASLTKCGWCLAGACLTRYDGWFLAMALGVAATWIVIASRQKILRRSLVKFLVLAVAAPVLWLGYNTIIYRNPLEFANGPYSARAIEQQKTALSKTAPHPGWHNLRVSFTYFLKAAEGNVALGNLQKIWLLVAAIGAILAMNKRRWPLLVLILPVAFYTLSLAFGSVPIYLPDWWPFSYYNVRFGLELLPAYAVMLALMVHAFFIRAPKRSFKAALVLGGVIFVAASYGFVWKAQPICYHEAWVNSRTRIAFEAALASTLLKLPHDSDLLMYLGDHVGALQDAGIPLRRTINEGNYRPWKRPSDSEGLWERALADPQKYVDYVIAIDDDPVATEVYRRDLASMVVVETTGQPVATIYWTHRNR